MPITRSLRLRSLALFASLLTFSAVALQAVPVPASAAGPEPGITELRQMVDDVGAWTSSLAEAGQLASAIPLVGGSAGAALGFPDLVQKTVKDKIASLDDYSDFDDETIPLAVSGGRTGELRLTRTSLADEGHRFGFEVDVTRTLTDQPFSLRKESPKLELNSSGGVTVKADAELRFSIVLEKVAGVYTAYVERTGATSPGFTVDVGVKLPSAAPGLSAALGILGVSAVEADADDDASLHLVGSASDPDGDGRLYVTRPDGSDGELKDPASASALWQVGFGGTPGSVDASLTVTATSDGAFSIPSTSGTVLVTWPNVSTGAPAVTVTGLDPLAAFQRLSPRDVADMLAQLVSVVNGAQRGPANKPLPFLSGSVADAVKGAEALSDFLTKNVVQPATGDTPVDPARVGQPTFASLQELLSKLNAYTGGTAVPGATIAATVGTLANDRLPLQLVLSRASTEVNLVENTVAVTGTASYGANTLTDSGGRTFAADMVGRRVTAGSSGGTVASAAGSVLTMATGWVGGQPANGTTYSVSGAEVDAGTVNFANLLGAGGKSIANANGVQPTAKVTPTYTATLKLALDLSAPRTTSACTDGPGGAPCPYSRTNLDGSKVTVTEEPLPVDRLLVGVGYDLLTARFPMTAGVDIYAKAGFLRVKVGGMVKVCSTDQSSTCTGASTQPMLKVELKKKTDEGDYVPVVQLFSSLIGTPSAIAERVGVTTQVRAYADGSIAVPDAADFLGSGGSAGFTASWPDIASTTPTITPDAGLSKILAFDFDASDPQALLGIVVRVLQLLDEQLQAGGGTGLLGAKVPLIDTSVGDLLAADESGGGGDVTYVDTPDAAGPPVVPGRTDLVDASRTGPRAFTNALIGRSVVVGTKVGIVTSVPNGTTLRLGRIDPPPSDGTPYTMRTELADAISLLTLTPPDSVQELIKVLDARLSKNTPLSFSYSDALGAPHLVVRLDWKRDYSVSAPIAFNVGGKDLAGTAGDGTARVSVQADVKTGLAIPLAIPAGGLTDLPLKVLDDSSVSVEATAGVDGTVRANLGPLALSLGKPGGTADEKAQASARYKLGLAKAGGTSSTASTLSAFLAAANVNVNDYTGGVSCGSGFTTGGDLALCANLPLYVTSNSGTSWEPLFPKAGEPALPDPDKGSVRIRLPKTGSDATTLFGLSGQVGGGNTQNRVDAPSAGDIAAAFAASLLDFGAIGDGLDAFLLLVQDSLNAASLEGKLPVVGADLQAGSDFVGDLRTELGELFDTIEGVNGGKLPDAGQVRNYLDTQFRQALTDAGAGPQNFSLAFTCVLQPADVTSATATYPPNNGADPPVATPTSSYEYAVVAVGSAGANSVDTVLGATKTVTGAAVLGGAVKNTVTWTTSDNATGYKIIRKKDGGGWQRVGTVGEVNTFDDTANSGPGYAPVASKPLVNSCDSAEIDDIEGVVLRVDIGAGTVDGTNGCTGAGCLETEIPLDPGLPGLTLKKADGSSGGVKAKLGWKIHLAVSLDKTDGFSILTKDQGLPEIGVGINLDLATPGPLTARLAFIDVDISKAAGATAPAFAAAFQVDLASGNAASEPSCYLNTEGPAACNADLSKKLTLAKLLGTKAYTDLVRPRLDLNLDVNWLLKAKVDAALPGIQARLVMTWDQVISTSSVSDSQLNSNLAVGFEDVAIDLGAFLGEILGPVVTQLKSVTGPLQPIVDTLYAPIPVLSDLSQAAGGPPVTLITLAKTFSTLAGGPKLDFVDTVAGVITFINNLPEPSPGNESVPIPIGSFDLASSEAFTVPATPDAAKKAIRNPAAQTGDATKTFIDSKSTKPALKTGVSDAAGITFPFLDDPSQIFNVIMGGDVSLVEFDSGDLTLGFTWRQAFGPVYAPPPVFITLSGAASVTARIVAGFDTYGLRKFVEDPSGSTAVGILNGLYFKTVDASGAPLPVIKLYGEIAAGAAVSAVIITVGIEGGVSLTVSFLWNDPNGDGKFRLFEFGYAAITNPICLFQTSGELALFLRVYITLGFSPFSVSFSFTLANITLLDFNVKPNCDPPPPILGGVSADGTTLVVFAGKLGTGGNRGHAAWDNNTADYGDDVVKVIQTHTYDEVTGAATPSGVKVQMLGVEDVWTGSVGAAIQRVVVDGRDYGHALKVSFLGDGDQTDTSTGSGVVPSAQFSLKAVVLGGSKDDVVKTGTGESTVSGGGGNDTITVSDLAGSGTTRIAGGPGDDSVTTGDNNAVVAGDSALSGLTNLAPQTLTLASNQGGGTKSVSGIVSWTALGNPSEGENVTDGNDRIAVGRGVNTVHGNGGDDAVGVASDSPLAGGPKAQTNTIVLGTGNDTAKGGSGNDTIWTGLSTTQTRGDYTQVDNDGGGEGGVPTRNSVDTGTGDDTVFGGRGDDWIQTGSTSTQKAFVTGGVGSDVLLGSHGTDELFGGPGKDWVVAEPATVGGSDGTTVDALGTLVRTYTKTPLPSGTLPSTKLLVGGDGADRVIGGNGASRIFGDQYETVDCGSVDATTPSTAPAEPAGGSPGRDLITGGEGIDKIKAGGAADLVRSFGADDLVCGQAGDDELWAGNGADTVWGGSDNDRAQGEAGSDSLFGNDGADQLFGADGIDLIEGNGGSDRLYGGTSGDTLVGGTRKAAQADAGDQLYGDEGDDVLVGDNSNPAGTYPADLGAPVVAHGGNDALYGGPDQDRAFGGLADDLVRGGDGRDHLEGNNGNDTVYGEAGEDEVLGGSTETAAAGVGRPDGADVVDGGPGNDVLAGDNADISGTGTTSPLLAGRGFAFVHSIAQLDLGLAPAAANSGSDTVIGGDGNDVALGGGKRDTMTGDQGEDYLEGNAGNDLISGGLGDDDIVGGGSVQQPDGSGQLDADEPATVLVPITGDEISAGAGSDVVLGDNGSILREGAAGYVVSPVTQNRFILPRGITVHDVIVGAAAAPDPTRSGSDTITGDAGNDVLLGQGGLDTVRGGADDDYVEGGQDADTLSGEAGDDDLVGGSGTPRSGSGTARVGQPDGDDTMSGGTGADVATGDNALLWRIEADGVLFEPITDRTDGGAKRALQLMDLGLNPAGGTSAGDRMTGGVGVDVLFGQGGDDVVKGNEDDDALLGGPGSDLLEGNEGQDDLVGGSAAVLGGSGEAATGQPDAGDHLYGGGNDDLLLGDNAIVLRAPAAAAGTLSALTDRIGMTGRSLTLLDRAKVGETYPTAVADRYGNDQLSGGSGGDVLLGQDGQDALSGGAGDDWLEGNGSDDRLWGDRGLTDPSISPAVAAVPLASFLSPEQELSGAPGLDGQDDVIGGSSNLPSASNSRTGSNGFRDGNDEIYGDGEADFELGDNGSLFRDVVAGAYTRIVERYPATGATDQASWAILRHALRLDVPATGSAPASGSSGNDRMQGNAGEDFMWGQSGDDVMNGNAGNDDMYGELGRDEMYGDAGEDAMLGDRGGIVTNYIDGSPTDPQSLTATLSGPPQETFTSLRPGSLDRRVDLLRDVAAHASLTGTTSEFATDEMASPGDKVGATGLAATTDANTGAGDRIRGGSGHDSIHGGFDRDLINGDSGGDYLFGGRGSDVIWGGKGCDTGPGSEDACTGTDLSERGADDRFVDHLVGGYGGLNTDGTGLPELLDFRPRGSTATPGTTCSSSLESVSSGGKKNVTTVDPCAWFEMTDTEDADPVSERQHHQGTDWIYGGWGRDVMEGDVAGNGPNPGDRLIDWTGTYNLYNHCNAAYGGFNDVRQFSPGMQDFLQKWAYGLGAGPTLSAVTSSSGSGFGELGLVYNSDVNANSGSAYPATPGHFENFSCAP